MNTELRTCLGILQSQIGLYSATCLGKVLFGLICLGHMPALDIVSLVISQDGELGSDTLITF